MIPGLTSLNGGELTIDFNLSTWNPYATVMMESNFVITPPSLGLVGSRLAFHTGLVADCDSGVRHHGAKTGL